MKTIRRILLIWTLCMLFATACISCAQKPQENPAKPIVEEKGGEVRFFGGNLFNEQRAKENVYLEEENVGNLTRSEVMVKIQNQAALRNRQVKDAKLDSKRWNIAEEEVTGVTVDTERTLNDVMNAAADTKVTIQVQETAPNITAEMLMQNVVEIGSFTTPLLDTQAERVNNIKIAAVKLDLVKLQPGEEFSFNGILGKRTEAKGYEEAPVIIKTEDGYERGIDVGGGICQLSTTIYNAVEKAKLKVTERHIHSKDVGYVPKGKDATVSYGAVDFRFMNTKNHPVMLRTYLSNKALTVKIFENRN